MYPSDALTAYGAMSVVAAAMVGGIGVLVWWWDRHHPVSLAVRAQLHCPTRLRMAEVDLVGDGRGVARLARCSLRADLSCDRSCLRVRAV